MSEFVNNNQALMLKQQIAHLRDLIRRGRLPSHDPDSVNLDEYPGIFEELEKLEGSFEL